MSKLVIVAVYCIRWESHLGGKKIVWGRCRFSRSFIQGIEVAAAMVIPQQWRRW